MSRVVFKDVVKRINVNVDRHNTERLYYVGGEHIDSCELLVTKHGLIEGSTIGFKFHFGFEPGHILFMSRNPHLRKASMATFSGICSDSTYVVETRDENVLLQKYLLLEMQSDRFWEWAEANKSGGVNYLINYKTLDTYEFDLPPLAEQKVLAEKLWAAYEVKQSYLKMIAATEEMVKSQFIEMFGDPTTNPKGWPIKSLGSSTKEIVGGECLNGTQRQKEYGEKAVLKVSAVSWGYFNEKEYKVLNDATSVKKGLYPCKGDLLFCRANTPENVGGTAFVDKDYPDLYLPDKIWKIIPNDDLTTLYLKHYMSNKNVRKMISNMASGTSNSMYNISMPKLRTLPVLIPPISLQHQFGVIYFAAEKSISELRKSVDAIDKVIKSLINENL